MPNRVRLTLSYNSMGRRPRHLQLDRSGRSGPGRVMIDQAAHTGSAKGRLTPKPNQLGMTRHLIGRRPLTSQWDRAGRAGPARSNGDGPGHSRPGSPGAQRSSAPNARTISLRSPTGGTAVTTQTSTARGPSQSHARDWVRPRPARARVRAESAPAKTGWAGARWPCHTRISTPPERYQPRV